MVEMSRNTLFYLTFAIFVVGFIYAGLFCDQGSKSNVQRPHIIVIIADDLGWNDVSFHGANQIPTPNIDALAYNGVILQRHYVLPTCTPSRTAFLTGRYPIRAGMQGYPLRAGEPRGIPLQDTLLPEYLQKLGYATHLIGKWHVGYYTNHHTPTYRGFDSFFGYYSGYIKYFNHTIMQENRTGYDLHYNVAEKLSVEYDYQYMTDLIGEKAEDIISTHDATKPLYLQLAHVAPHASDAKDTMEVRDMKEVNETLGHIENLNRRKFGGLVTALDKSVGRVVSALKEAKLLENSIIVFVSDNGAQTEGLMENFGSNYPLRGLKFTLYEGGIRGVACVYSPLIKRASRVSNQLFHITDWLPTFYSAAGGNLEDLQNVDGVDQWSTITLEEETKRKAVLLNIDEVENSSAALIGRFKLIRGGKLEYGDYYGDSGKNESYPPYNVSRVLRSATALAIAGVSKFTLNSGDVIQLREDTEISCKKILNYPQCTNQCLFDVYDDPCESMDLSSKYSKIVDELDVYIKQYRRVLMNQTNAEIDPASYPENFNGVWRPWLKYTTGGDKAGL